jgi:hypothetical protein
MSPNLRHKGMQRVAQQGDVFAEVELQAGNGQHAVTPNGDRK